jgi:hypothetical protein
LEKEDDAAGFFGVLLERNATIDVINVQQTDLTGRGIEALRPNVDNVNRNSSTIWVLGKGMKRAPTHGDFNYVSVVGMML